jgi:exodeoxyribonuclease VII large subunit
MTSRFTRRSFAVRRVTYDRIAEAMLPFGEGGPEASAVSVSQFILQINGALRAGVPDSWVRGEISGWKPWKGMVFFSLKDDRATLKAKMWPDRFRLLPFTVEEGLEVLARGRAEVWAGSGDLSLIVSDLQPYGIGALQLAFEQLKARLSAEGLFDPSKKRPLPLLPRRIGVVTSRHAAALRDILKVLSARFPNAHVTIYPVAVQGAAAAAEIARGVAAFSRMRGADVLIVARGGGSKEDLQAFNDERVVRAVAASQIPTISAVGHEVDVTLTDLAADVRAATPSQAAELVVARREELETILGRNERDLKGFLRGRMNEARAELGAWLAARGFAGFERRVEHQDAEARAAARALVSSFRSIPSVFGERLARAHGRLLAWPDRAAFAFRGKQVDEELRALTSRLAARLERAVAALSGRAAQLEALNPLRVLARGYSVTYREGETAPLTDAARVAAGDALHIRLARGTVGARVTGTRTDDES